MPTGITKADRDALLMLCRQRERVARSEVDALMAQRKAEFEAELAAEFSFDQDEVWRESHKFAKEAAEKAMADIERRNAELGIRPNFAPGIILAWYSRGENASRQRRAELTRVAHSQIEADGKTAKVHIARASVDIQTKLVAATLQGDDAQRFLESMPTPHALMPQVKVADLQKQLGPVNDEPSVTESNW